jgi:hypothetical protein
MTDTPAHATATIYNPVRLFPVSNKPGVATIVIEKSDSATKVTSVAFYIDADNQSSQCVKALIDLFICDPGMRVISAAIAGNNHGKEIECWRHGLVSEVPDINLRLLDVCSRKQAADIALIMELGANLERHINERERVVIVSRDEFLIGAAEHAKSRGCMAFISYANSEIPVARSTQLTTFLLPAIAKPLPYPATPVDQDQKTVTPKLISPPISTDATVLAKLRQMCQQQPGGGYGASDVGQVLLTLGFNTKAAREKFLKSIPGLKKRGTGPDKILVF